jgi:tRNA(Ile)-lysidine synthase
MFYPLSVILKAIFLNYGFSKLYNLKCFILSSSSGKSLYTSKYRLIKHAKYLILTYNIKIINKCFFIHNINICRIIYPINLLFINSVFIDDKANICIDYKKIILPIYLRRWRVGDYFYPLGLNGKKKVSKYFKDQKLSILERENVWLLINGDDKIIWIVNYILDDRFKITTSTINVLNIYL